MARMSFEQWMKKVDSHIIAICGLSYMDLADQPYYDWYDNRTSPKAAAKRALRNEGFPF